MNARTNSPGYSAEHQNYEVKSPLSSVFPDDLGEAFLILADHGNYRQKAGLQQSGHPDLCRAGRRVTGQPRFISGLRQGADVSDSSWDKVQKRFLKLSLHERTANGMNVHRYLVTGQNRSTAINGILVRDVGRIFRTANLQPNPHLRRAS